MGQVSQYHLKPPVNSAIEAVQWDGTPEDAANILSWVNKFKAPHESIIYVPQGNATTDISYIQIKSGHISMSARVGDYVVWSSKSKSEPKRFAVHTQRAFEAGYYQVGTKPAPSRDQALEELRRKLTGG